MAFLPLQSTTSETDKQIFTTKILRTKMMCSVYTQTLGVFH